VGSTAPRIQPVGCYIVVPHKGTDSLIFNYIIFNL
jgi:hypothetical protein